MILFWLLAVGASLLLWYGFFSLFGIATGVLIVAGSTMAVLAVDFSERLPGRLSRIDKDTIDRY